MTYAITAEDFIAVSDEIALVVKPGRIRAERNWNGDNVVIGVVLLGVVIAAAWFYYTRGAGPLAGLNWGVLGLLLFAACLLIASPIRYRRRLAACYRLMGFDGKTFQLEWTESQMVFASESARSVYGWSAFRSYVETKGALVLILENGSRSIVPRRYFEKNEYDSLVGLLARNVASPTKS